MCLRNLSLINRLRKQIDRVGPGSGGREDAAVDAAPPTFALLALMHLHAARLASRQDATGAGPLENARYIEAYAILVICLGHTLGLGTNVAMRLMRR